MWVGYNENSQARSVHAATRLQGHPFHSVNMDRRLAYHQRLDAWRSIILIKSDARVRDKECWSKLVLVIELLSHLLATIEVSGSHPSFDGDSVARPLKLSQVKVKQCRDLG